MIFLIVGYPCSGKTTVRNIIQKLLQCEGYEASDYAKKVIYDFKMKDIFEVQEKLGRDVVARKIVSHIQDANKQIVVSGLRTCEELHFFNSLFDCFIISISCPVSTTQERMLRRKRSDEDWINRIESDKALGIEEVIRYADYHLDNDKDINALEYNVGNLIGMRNDLS